MNLNADFLKRLSPRLWIWADFEDLGFEFDADVPLDLFFGGGVELTLLADWRNDVYDFSFDNLDFEISAKSDSIEAGVGFGALAAKVGNPEEELGSLNFHVGGSVTYDDTGFTLAPPVSSVDIELLYMQVGESIVGGVDGALARIVYNDDNLLDETAATFEVQGLENLSQNISAIAAPFIDDLADELDWSDCFYPYGV